MPAITLGKYNKQGFGIYDFLTCGLLRNKSHFCSDGAVHLTILSFRFQRFIESRASINLYFGAVWIELGALQSAS